MSVRAIAHLDLDCFYCQVEHKRLNIPRDIPLCVQQWNSVIAVNYAARAEGIKRGMSADDCKKRCPTIQLVHVDLIEDKCDDQSTLTKVSLERYRNASMEIMSIFQRLCPSYERASIDEAYLDVTEYLKDVSISDIGDPDIFVGFDGNVVLPNNPTNELFIRAAVFVSQVRRTVYDELGYTVSAGISLNKLLAKQASAVRKPNKQTIVPLSAIEYMMSHTRISDVRGFGGKLGEQIITFSGAIFASDLQVFSEQELCAQFGDKTGKWIHRICRGIDDEPVKLNGKPKSILAFKSFSDVNKKEDLDRWVFLLCQELLTRLRAALPIHHQLPRNLSLQHGLLTVQDSISSGPSGSSTFVLTTSRTCPIWKSNKPTLSLPSVHDLQTTCWSLLAKVPKLFPCARLGLGLTDMVDVTPPSESIAKFFGSRSSVEVAAAVSAPDKLAVSTCLLQSSATPDKKEKPRADAGDVGLGRYFRPKAQQCLGSPLASGSPSTPAESSTSYGAIPSPTTSWTTTTDILGVDLAVDINLPIITQSNEADDKAGSHSDQTNRRTDAENDDPNAGIIYVTCDECGCEIPDFSGAMQEHRDYHFSLLLQRELDLQQSTTGATDLQHSFSDCTHHSTSTATARKKSAGPKHPASKRPRSTVGGIDSFFRKDDS